jgi:hypothetical protein
VCIEFNPVLCAKNPEGLEVSNAQNVDGIVEINRAVLELRLKDLGVVVFGDEARLFGNLQDRRDFVGGEHLCSARNGPADWSSRIVELDLDVDLNSFGRRASGSFLPDHVTKFPRKFLEARKLRQLLRLAPSFLQLGKLCHDCCFEGGPSGDGARTNKESAKRTSGDAKMREYSKEGPKVNFRIERDQLLASAKPLEILRLRLDCSPLLSP